MHNTQNTYSSMFCSDSEKLSVVKDIHVIQWKGLNIYRNAILMKPRS